MSAHNTVLSSIQKKNASESAMVSAFDNENESAAKEQKKGKEAK